jgi:hypothetical protein
VEEEEQRRRRAVSQQAQRQRAGEHGVVGVELINETQRGPWSAFLFGAGLEAGGGLVAGGYREAVLCLSGPWKRAGCWRYAGTGTGTDLMTRQAGRRAGDLQMQGGGQQKRCSGAVVAAAAQQAARRRRRLWLGVRAGVGRGYAVVLYCRLGREGSALLQPASPFGSINLAMPPRRERCCIQVVCAILEPSLPTLPSSTPRKRL